MLSRLFIAALWSPEGKGLTSWLLFVMFFCDFVTFPFGILGQVWYLIVSIPDPCCLSYLECSSDSKECDAFNTFGCTITNSFIRQAKLISINSNTNHC